MSNMLFYLTAEQAERPTVSHATGKTNGARPPGQSLLQQRHLQYSPAHPQCQLGERTTCTFPSLTPTRLASTGTEGTRIAQEHTQESAQGTRQAVTLPSAWHMPSHSSALPQDAKR